MELYTFDLVAPTGVATFGIHGWTINFGLTIPVKEGTEFNQLGQSSLACFQTHWKEIKLLILDEKSMVGRSQVGHIDHPLHQAYPQNADYSEKRSAYCTALHEEGHCVFESFNQSVTLKTVFHQTGKNAEQVKFREALLRLCTYSTTPEDYALFSTQFWEISTPVLRAEFNDVFHLLQHMVLFWNSIVVNWWPVLNPYYVSMPNIIIKRLVKLNQMMQKDWKRNCC